MFSIEDVNNLTRDEFIAHLGNIVQSAPWVTSDIYKYIPFKTSGELHQRVCTILDGLSLEGKVSILQGHPNLAGTEAKEDNLNPDSKREQTAAGMLDLSRDRAQLMDKLNDEYKRKFGFPFVICARLNNPESILKALKNRLDNSRDDEVVVAINEEKMICWYRICDVIMLQSLPESKL